MTTKIEWCDESWNPIKMRCTKISEGCLNCYADRLLSRNLPGFAGYPKNGDGPVMASLEVLNAPLEWKAPRRIFVESMGDLFHESVPDWMIDRVFDRVLYDGISHHTFMILTKRPERMYEYIKGHITKMDLFDNVWLGVTAENQRTADERIPILLQIPAAVRFVSVEPMLGPITLRRKAESDQEIIQATLMDKLDDYSRPVQRGIDWVICGAETGAKARPINADWVEGLLQQCRSSRVPFFFKKWGDHPIYDHSIDADHEGLTPNNEMPREWPKVATLSTV